MLAVPDIVVITLRAASFVADFQTAGVAMFLAFFGGNLANSKSAIRSLGGTAAAAGIFLTLAHYLVEPARMAADMSGVFDGSLQIMLLSTNVATTASLRILGLFLIALGLARETRAGDGTGLIGATLVVLSFALLGHTASHDLRWLLIVLLVSHLTIVAIWFGALLPLFLAAKRESIDILSSVITLFSCAASWLVPFMFVFGIVMSIVLLEHLDNLWTPYGISILLKIAGFAILMALATLNKWRLGPSIAAGSNAALTAFRRTTIAEWCLIVAVLSVTAVMTGLFSPTH